MVTATNNNTSIELKDHDVCWNGGFMKTKHTHFHINISSTNYTINYSTSRARVHSLTCTGVSDAGLISMVVVFPVLFAGIFTFILLTSLNVERIGHYEKI